MKFFDTFFDMLGLKQPASATKPAASKAAVAQKQSRVAMRRAKPANGQLVEVSAITSVAVVGPGAAVSPTASAAEAPRAKRPAKKAALYETMTREMLQRYDIRVRKWRSSMSGVAWYVTYRDGSVQRLLESPKPKSPMSAAIFLHEVGHHAIGFNVYKPRCLEEYHAWQYSLAQMRQWNIPITPKVMQRYQRSMKYAVGKATRRGIRSLPSELLPFAQGM